AWRATILRGLLGADVVGVQTGGDAWEFLTCCAELLHLPVDMENRIVTCEDGRRVRVAAYPASVDIVALETDMKTPAVGAARDRLAGELGPLSIIRVDRLDPSKNQLIGFQAFERLLEMRPDLRGRVRFSAFLVPSRTDLGVYRAYHDALYKRIDAINAR